MVNRFIQRLLLTISLLLVTACGSEPSPDQDSVGATPVSPTSVSTEVGSVYVPPHNQPGPAMDTVHFKAFHVDRAPLHVQAGDMDLYMSSLKSAAAKTLQTDPNIHLYKAPATTLSIILNPAPAPEGQINPFAIKRIRQAIQLLVNREFIVNDIYQGSATPMVTHLSTFDFDFLTVYEQVKSSDIQYDPDLAKSMIAEEMTKLGATLEDGKWTFMNRPVRLKFIIRVEDERRSVGDLLRVALEQSGFTVAASYQQFAPAVLSVYSSDPKAFEWHLYTEGWARSSPNRYDFATINQMTAPWLGNMPGWLEVGFWQYKNPELDRLGQSLFTGKFGDPKERNSLYQQMTALALDESVRINVATVINSFPANNNLNGVTEDLVAGPRGPWTIREAFIPGKEQMTIGNLWVWTERSIWNPVGGFTDAYTNDIWRNLYDPPIWNHPFTGTPIPFRASFQIDTSGANAKVDVPSDAVIWDANADQWKPVGNGVTAISKVTFDYSKYFTSKWHHGEPITMADVIYPIVQGYELAYDDHKSRIEFALGVTSRPYLDTLRGFRILDEYRLEVYVDFWHFDVNQIASYASPSSLSTPWELMFAMDHLVFSERRAAYTDTAAARFNVPWISLVMDKDARLVTRTLKDLSSDQAIPDDVFLMGNQALTNTTHALNRYQASINWFDKYGLLIISNGPFILTKYDPPAQFAEIKANRDSSYPFRPGDWYLGTAPPLEISQITTEQIVVGEKADLKITVSGPGSIGLHYLITDPASGKIVIQGDMSAKETFNIELGQELTETLTPGIYRLSLAAFSDSLVTLKERMVDLEVVP